jgi:hypothetical protein
MARAHPPVVRGNGVNGKIIGIEHGQKMAKNEGKMTRWPRNVSIWENWSFCECLKMGRK